MKEQAIEMVRQLMEAPTVTEELQLACGKYLAEIGTDNEKAAAEEFFQVLNDNVNSIDESLAFFKSDAGKTVFGDKVDGYITAFEEAREKGELYCQCPACQLGRKIYEMKDELL